MDKKQAQALIRETFELPFDKGRFANFIINLLNLKAEQIEHKHPYGGNFIPDSYEQSISTLERIAKYTDGEHKIDILIVKLKKETSIERARSMQRNFIAWYLNGSRGGDLKDAALAAFVSPNEEDWRFSLVKMDYRFEEGRNGRMKIKEEFTPARRWSFLVGANENSHTAQGQLVDLLADDEHSPILKQLEEAFNIEKVTKEFFEKYQELFLWAKETLDEVTGKDKKIKTDFETKSVNSVNFAKKLLGQIVFLYFLQKKGWFGVARDADWGTGPKNFLRELFEGKHSKYENFFNDILEPLFYEALRNDRSHDDHYFSMFKCKIPFLNGGLFDPINVYDWKGTDILLPNELFSNKKKTKEGDTGDGILDIFDRYNFTVKEDEPLEKEVAIDPEMLGKVFENLLEVKDRKSKGTYYTPREIVHYMCQQSLINYLDVELNSECAAYEIMGKQQLDLFGNKTKKGQLDLIIKHGNEQSVPKEDIEILIKHGETVGENEAIVQTKGRETDTYYHKLPEAIRANAGLIDEKLAKIKVCDPAIGSGAFPVGMMSEIVKTRNVLSAFIQEKNRSIYNFKRDCIQNSLYGVDIDPGAVEIAKLRLWLSLVVDEDDIKQIKPLPNLDYKIVCGNSLLGVEKELLNWKLFKELENLKPLLFNETNPAKKQEYKKQIDDLIGQITNSHKEFDFEVYFSEVFHEKKGFDVVIANPPYVGEKGHKEMFREIKKGNLWRFYQGKMDLFYFFFHLALNLGKQNSNIAFITTNYYLTATGAKKLRQDFKERTIIKNLINFNELKIFESAIGQHNIVTILKKAQKEKATANTCISQRRNIATPEILQQILNGNDTEAYYYKVIQRELYDGDQYYIRLTGRSGSSDNPEQTILDKVKKQGDPLEIICNINSGADITISRITEKHLSKFKGNFNKMDGVFVLTAREVENLKPNKDEQCLLKTFIKNSDIYSFCIKSSAEKLIYLKWEDDIKKFPNIKNHLLKFKKILDDQKKRYEENYPWFALHRPREQNIFEVSEKILVPYRNKKNIFGYTTLPVYSSRDAFFITEKDKSVFLKYVLALLNSKLYYLWLYHRGKRKGETLELYQKPLSEIPIKKISKPEQYPFIILVDRILAITNDEDYLQNPDKQAKVKEYERQIDQMVYKLYALTPVEVKIVEGCNHGE